MYNVHDLVGSHLPLRLLTSCPGHNLATKPCCWGHRRVWAAPGGLRDDKRNQQCRIHRSKILEFLLPNESLIHVWYVEKHITYHILYIYHAPVLTFSDLHQSQQDVRTASLACTLNKRSTMNPSTSHDTIIHLTIIWANHNINVLNQRRPSLEMMSLYIPTFHTWVNPVASSRRAAKFAGLCFFSSNSDHGRK